MFGCLRHEDLQSFNDYWQDVSTLAIPVAPRCDATTSGNEQLVTQVKMQLLNKVHYQLTYQLKVSL